MGPTNAARLARRADVVRASCAHARARVFERRSDNAQLPPLELGRSCRNSPHHGITELILAAQRLMKLDATSAGQPPTHDTTSLFAGKQDDGDLTSREEAIGSLKANTPIRYVPKHRLLR